MHLNNTYYLLRHGEAQSNARDLFSSWPETFVNPLTDAGVEMIEEAVGVLKDKNIAMIFASDMLRTKQTAQIVADALGLEVNLDVRLREIGFGSVNGAPVGELEIKIGRYKLPGYGQFGGEDYEEVLDRVFAFFQEVEVKYAGRIILIVSHQAVLSLLEEKVKGFGVTEILAKVSGYTQIKKGEVRELTTTINEEVIA